MTLKLPMMPPPLHSYSGVPLLDASGDWPWTEGVCQRIPHVPSQYWIIRRVNYWWIESGKE